MRVLLLDLERLSSYVDMHNDIVLPGFSNTGRFQSYAGKLLLRAVWEYYWRYKKSEENEEDDSEGYFADWYPDEETFVIRQISDCNACESLLEESTVPPYEEDVFMEVAPEKIFDALPWECDLETLSDDNILKDLPIRKGERGKGYLDGHFYYNISHSGNYVAMAFSFDTEVGVDIDDLKRGKEADRLSKRFFATAETDFLHQFSEEKQKAEFIKLWCRKEAYGKLLGVGLTEEVMSTNMVSSKQENITFWEATTIDGYQICLCFNG